MAAMSPPCVGGQAGDLRQGADHLGMQALVGGKIGCLDPQEVFHRTGHVVAFAHFRGAGDGAFEGLLRVLGVFLEAHRQEGREARAAGGGVDDGAVAADGTRAFQRLHPA